MILHFHFNNDAPVAGGIIENMQIQDNWLSSARHQHQVAKVQRWQQEVPEMQQTHQDWRSHMENNYDELQACKSKLEEADSRLEKTTLSSSSVTSLTGATNMIPLETLRLAFQETVKWRSCASGEVESVEVQGSDGSRMIWSCNRSKH